MTILQLTVHFSPNIGGVETHLDDLVEGLIKRKNKVFVLTYRPLTTKTEWKTYEVDEKKQLKILRLPWLPGYFYELVNKPIVEFLYLFPGLFIATPFAILLTRPKVIHAHGIIAGIIAVFWGKIFRKRVVISTHSIYHFPKEGTYTSVVRSMCNNADEVLCLSKQSAQEIIGLGIPQKKVSVFTYWIDLNKFKQIPNAKKKLDLPKKFTVLFVGRLITEKGVMELLEAAKQIGQNVSFLIAGTGPLEGKVLEAQKSDVVAYVGKISQKDLPLYYSGADVLIVPSVHEEGFGRVMLESLACGTPVIAADRGGIREAITTAVGFLIPISPENIAKTIVYCARHPDELRRKAKNARNFAEKHYSDSNVESIIHSYE